MQALEAITAAAALLLATSLACAAEPSNSAPKEAQAMQWITGLPDRVGKWLETVQHNPEKPGEPWGLFAFSADSKIPYCIASTAIGWAYAEVCGGIEKLPGYHAKAKEEMAAWVQKFQDPDTRQFIDPVHESCVADIGDPRVRYSFREAVSKYAVGLLNRCGAKPLYPYVFGGDEEGKFDPEHYLEFIKDGDWDNAPWGIGSHAALQTVQLFELVNQGRDDLVPALIKGTEFILSKQNPRTGMWGSEKASLDQQIGGTLKVIGRFQWYMGLIVPHMRQLADSIIANHESGAFYVTGDTPCVPRNVAEMAYACMEASDYRKSELRQVLLELVDQLKRFGRDDGAFSSTWAGTNPIGWCQSVVSGKAEKPRSDLVGTQLCTDTAVRLYERLGWIGGPWAAPKDWRKAIEEKGYVYTISCDRKGKVTVTPRQRIEAEE